MKALLKGKRGLSHPAGKDAIVQRFTLTAKGGAFRAVNDIAKAIEDKKPDADPSASGS
tara:strand:+ start:7280 stop:7453 length:174 start_codon:yes stop_codon:yes gene_type:complete